MAGPGQSDRPGDSDRQDESGAIAVMAAVIILAVLAATSLAVDVGRTAFVSRDLQGVTDRAALDSVTAVNRAANAGITTLSGLHDGVEVAVGNSLTRNPGTSEGTAADREVTLLELGRVVDGSFEAMCNEPYDPAVPANCAADTTGAWTVADVTAVRIATESFVPFVFAIGEEGRDVTRTAVAESKSLASVTVGSELAGVEGGLVEDTLNGLVCGMTATPNTCTLDISAASYQGLATTQIELGDLVGELSTVVGSPDAVFTSDITVVQFLSAVANVLDNAGKADQAEVVFDDPDGDGIAGGGVGAVLPTDQLDFALEEIVQLHTVTPDQAADASLNVLELVKASLQVANGENLIALPNLEASIPGVADVEADLTVIEAPQTDIGPARQLGGQWLTSATTSQVDLNLEPTLGSDSGLLGALGPVVETDVRLPLHLEVAQATVDLTDIACATASGGDPDVTTLVNSDVSRLRIGDFDEAGNLVPATLFEIRVGVDLGLVDVGVPVAVKVKADDIDLGGVSDASVAFTSADGAYPRGPRTVPGTPLNLGDVSSGDLQVTTEILGASVSGLDAAINTLVAETILPGLVNLLGTLDGALLQPVLSTLGAGTGNAAVWANWAHCQGRELAWLAPDG